MPRPNHDIPSYLIGGIKDYARAEDISVDTAHTRLLAYALQKTGTIECVEGIVDEVSDPEDEEGTYDD